MDQLFKVQTVKQNCHPRILYPMKMYLNSDTTQTYCTQNIKGNSSERTLIPDKI